MTISGRPCAGSGFTARQRKSALALKKKYSEFFFFLKVVPLVRTGEDVEMWQCEHGTLRCVIHRPREQRKKDHCRPSSQNDVFDCGGLPKIGDITELSDEARCSRKDCFFESESISKTCIFREGR